ncbi:MAG: hypothetical protein LBC09_05705 [Helicobacteraceae bacterium]|jgi:hypothetical protein|nr:hypothetical protein [Helicobacteraceae bacterium]
MRIALALAAALLTLVGCADKSQPEVYELGGIPEKAPVWIKNPDYKGRFAAAGGAAQSVGGAKFQQIEASARASEILRVRLEKIAFAAAKKILSALSAEAADETAIDADARLVSLMIVARASSQFARVDNWWSPSRDYYALLRISEETLGATIADAIAQFARSSERYSAKFGMLRGLESIDNAASGAIAAEK